MNDASGPRLDNVSDRPGVIYYAVSSDQQQYWVTMTGLLKDTSSTATLKSMLNRVLLAAGLSWVCSVTLGLLFAACASGRLSFSTLKLPGVVPVALISSTNRGATHDANCCMGCENTGTRNMYLYGPILWIVLAVWLVVVVPWNPAYGEYSVLILGLVGLVVLGFIPAHK